MRSNLKSIFQAVVIGGCVLVGACSEENTATCPTCAAGQVCNESTGKCVATDGQVKSSSCLDLCGLNTDCSSAQDCRCKSGWNDCNTDIGKAGGNGCECSQDCVGTNCGTGVKDCEAHIYNSCGDKNLYCEGTTCTRCEEGTYNCDGIDICEEAEPCAKDGCETFGSKTCGSQSQYCDEESGECLECADGTYNCSSNGGDCECTNGCDGSSCLDICQFDQGCDTDHFCDIGDCIACLTPGTKNCDGKGWCECTGTCNGTQCIGDRSCDYYDESVCGGDNTKWCYESVCQLCAEDSPGTSFNCNGTKGCECDEQGCNGTACAGKCSGGEC